MKLEDIAHCQTGLVLNRYRGRTDYRLFSAKQIDDLGIIHDTEIFQGYDIPAQYMAQPNDIIMKIAAPNFAVLIPEQWQGTVISSFYFLIRVKDPAVIDPRFLTVYLNSLPFQQAIEQALICSTVKALKISTLRQLEIPALARERQLEIVTLADAMRQEELCWRDFHRKQQAYYQQALAEQLSEEKGLQHLPEN